MSALTRPKSQPSPSLQNRQKIARAAAKSFARVAAQKHKDGNHRWTIRDCYQTLHAQGVSLDVKPMYVYAMVDGLYKTRGGSAKEFAPFIAEHMRFKPLDCAKFLADLDTLPAQLKQIAIWASEVGFCPAQQRAYLTALRSRRDHPGLSQDEQRVRARAVTEAKHAVRQVNRFQKYYAGLPLKDFLKDTYRYVQPDQFINGDWTKYPVCFPQADNM